MAIFGALFVAELSAAAVEEAPQKISAKLGEVESNPVQIEG